MSLFACKDKEVPFIRKDRLMAVTETYFPGVELDDEYIYAKLLAAESEAEHKLRTFFAPVEVVPEGTPQAEIDALIAAKTRFIEEPAYDWDPAFFRGNQWGFIATRQRPIISVDYLRFVYPSTEQSLYTIPAQWVRLDKKYGQIRIVPGGDATTLPLNAWLLQVYGGGRMIPHMLRVRYRAGLMDARRDYPELIDTIRKNAVLKILEDLYVPQSGSISADGLSESVSFDIGKYKDNAHAILDAIRDQLKGVRMVVL